jgi:gamma-glutamylaminecyclotransferase
MNPILTDPFFLFAFGTLMTDGPRHQALAGARLLRCARTEAHYQLLDLGAYPGLIRVDQGGRSVLGELYEVPLTLVASLDEIEGAPTLFRLEAVRIQGAEALVFAYFYQPRRECASYSLERWDNARLAGTPEARS